MSDELMLVDGGAAIDDCWNRIGVQGDKSCERLREHVHCRNCEVYAAAATRLLERYASLQDDVELVVQEQAVACCSLLVFRIAEEWLAIATRSLDEVVAPMPIHSLPHQRSRSLLGVANVRGTLVACLSLGELLGISVGGVPPTQQRVTPRMLILTGQGGPVVVPVDEVDGIHAIPLHSVLPAVRDGGLAVSQFASGVVQWQGRSLTRLDDELLRQAIARSLA
jgi:chemotaxis-related protein WspD